MILTEDLVVEYANDRFFETFMVSADETAGFPLSTLGNGQWNIQPLLAELGKLLSGADDVENFEVEHAFEHIGRRVMRLNARKTVRPGNGSRRILLAIEDVTREHDAMVALERQRLLSVGIVDTVREPLLVLDEQLTIVSASRSFYTTFEVDASQTIGRRLEDLGNGQWSVPALLGLLKDVLPKNSVVDDFEVHHRFDEIGEKVILLNARKVFREGNHAHLLLLAMQDITERRRLETERQAALDHAERLLEELNHRVMNSLSMIGGIIALEARNMTDETCKAAFAQMRARIDSIASLYRTLSRTRSVDMVTADAYLTALVESIVASSDQAENLTLELDVSNARLSTRVAVPLGLIVNELVTNSLKYAYIGRSGGTLGVSLSVEGASMTVSVWDDGPGIDVDAPSDSGLGHKLTAAFTTQLEGTLSVSSTGSGTRHTLVVPL
ncbi:histidine kinase dimerization/phosphoacceptor domain -containing protein [Sulfitobacter sp. LCG007]